MLMRRGWFRNKRNFVKVENQELRGGIGNKS
jgi:hypothetical protein